MTTNFDFLKAVDIDLYKIITEAERLYRDEYFEQCMTQTRRFGESICKNVLGSARTTESTFDDMLATLKDKSTGEEQEKEFIDDLYFLKKSGNTAVHSVKVQHDGMTALECLQRAFEVAINYCVYNQGSNSRLLKFRFDTELLVTGKKSKKSLSERYTEEKKKTEPKRQTKPTQKKQKQQSYSMKTATSKNKLPIFWILVGFTSAISIGIIITLFLIIKL